MQYWTALVSSPSTTIHVLYLICYLVALFRHFAQGAPMGGVTNVYTYTSAHIRV